MVGSKAMLLIFPILLSVVWWESDITLFSSWWHHPQWGTRCTKKYMMCLKYISFLKYQAFRHRRTYSTQNTNKAVPRWMCHNHFHPCTTTQDSGCPCCRISCTQLKLIYANTTQNRLQALSLVGKPFSCDLAEVNNDCPQLPISFSAQVIIYSLQKITLMAKEKQLLTTFI